MEDVCYFFSKTDKDKVRDTRLLKSFKKHWRAFVLDTLMELSLKIICMHGIADLLKEETNHGSKRREMSNVEHATERRFNKGLWSQEEDDLLKAYVQKHGEGNWKSVQKHSGLSRCGKSCRLRWMNHLKPDLKKGAFTQEEQDRIVELHVLHRNKWAKIAAQLPGRTDNEIKNYWNTRAKRFQRLGLPLYPEGVRERVLNATAQSGVNIDVHQAQEDYSEAERFDLPIPHFKCLPNSVYPSFLSTRFTMSSPSFFQNTYNSIASSIRGPETSVPFSGGYTMDWQSLLLGNQLVQNMDRHLFGNATTYSCPFENLEFPSIQCSNYHQVPNCCGAQQSNSMLVFEEVIEQSDSMQVIGEQCDLMLVFEEKSDQFLEEPSDTMLVLESYVTEEKSDQFLEEPSDTMMVLEEPSDSMLVREGQSDSMLVLEKSDNNAFLDFPMIDHDFDAIISESANITGECFDFVTMLDYGCSTSSNETTSPGG